MTPSDAIGLGALQGLTEFLPVSSSGHLRLAQHALGAQSPSLLFDIALHLGTLVAVVAFFGRDLRALVLGLAPRGAGRWRDQPAVRANAALIVASIPTAILGLLLDPIVSGPVPVQWVGLALIANGGILLSTRGRIGGEQPEPGANWGIGLTVALVIGIAQGLAVIPGISRSGATIATALLCGVKWRPAAAFSFLLSIPAILGALALKIGDAGELSSDAGPIALGVAVALVSGLAALTLLVGLLRRARFHHFAWYCFGLGVVAIVWGLVG